MTLFDIDPTNSKSYILYNVTLLMVLKFGQIDSIFMSHISPHIINEVFFLFIGTD